MNRRAWLGNVVALGGWALAARRSPGACAMEPDEDEAGAGLLVETGIQDDQTLSGVFVVDPDSSRWRKVLATGNRSARVAPDRRSIAFVKFRLGAGLDGLWVAEIDGEREPRRIAEKGGRACWEPEGKSLIVSWLAERDGDTIETWRIRADGTEKTRLELPGNELVMDLSADGHWLLSAIRYPVLNNALKRTQTYKVFVRRADGSDPHLLTEGTRYVTHRFAPDGNRVVYTRNEGDDEIYSLWTIGRDGKDDRCLIHGNADRSPFFACWSPDGKRLAVDMIELLKDDDGKSTDRTRQIEIMPADGGERRPLSLPFTEGIPTDWR